MAYQVNIEELDVENAGKVAYLDDNEKAYRFCLCGCSTILPTPNPKTKFRPGHDARFIRLVRLEIQGELELNNLQQGYAEWRELYPYVEARLAREAAIEAAKMEAKMERERKALAKKKEKQKKLVTA